MVMIYEEDAMVRFWFKIKDDRWSLTDFTMLHYVQLPQPRLVERVAGCMDDVT